MRGIRRVGLAPPTKNAPQGAFFVEPAAKITAQTPAIPG